jgi:hypothetical protein
LAPPLLQHMLPISKQPKQTELFRNKPKQIETTLNFLKNTYICSFKLFGLVFCLFRFNRNIETLCFCIKAKQPKQTVSKQTENKEKTGKTLNFKNTKICSLSNYFDWSSVCAETGFGSSFGCFEWKLVSKDTLILARLPDGGEGG